MQLLFRVQFLTFLALVVSLLGIASCARTPRSSDLGAAPTTTPTPSSEVFEVQAKELSKPNRFCAVLRGDVSGTELKAGYYLVIERGSDGTHTVIQSAPEFKPSDVEMTEVTVVIPGDTKVSQAPCG